MKKWVMPLVISLLILCSTNSIAQNILAVNPIGLALTVGQWLIKNTESVYYLRVEASGSTLEQAKQEGLRFAVNKAVGTLVLAETQVKNQEVIRHDITLYSSGYVDDYKVLSEESLNGNIKLVMDVWVAESKIANRLFALSKGEEAIDGSKVATQYQTIMQERNQGDRVIQLVANDFPQKAFTINMGKLSWRVVDRDPEILVPVEISWSTEYLNAMQEALVRTRNGNDPANQRYGKAWPSVVSLKHPNDWFTTYAAYADVKKAESLTEHMVGTKPSIQVSIKNAVGEAVYGVCVNMPYFSGAFFGESLAFEIYAHEKFGYPTGQFFASRAPDADFAIYGDFKVNTTFKLPIRNAKPEVLNAMESIEVNVVPSAQCEKSRSQVI